MVRHALWRLLLALTLVLTLDVLTKRWAQHALAHSQPMPVVGRVVRLALDYNTGVVFGLLAERGPWLLITRTLTAGLV